MKMGGMEGMMGMMPGMGKMAKQVEAAGLTTSVSTPDRADPVDDQERTRQPADPAGQP